MRNVPETEAEFLGAVLELAHLHGWLVYHTRDSRQSAAGFPDLVLVRHGRVVFAELKTETGKVTVDQAAWLAEVDANAGVEVWLWRPSDWATVAEVLQ